MQITIQIPTSERRAFTLCVEEAVTRPLKNTGGWATPCQAAEKAEAQRAVELIKEQTGDKVTLDAFQWGCIKSELSRHYIACGSDDRDVLGAFWRIHQAMAMDPGYAAMEAKAAAKEAAKRKIERIRSKVERYKSVLNAADSGVDPERALSQIER